MLLANERTQKRRKKGTQLTFKPKSFLLKNIKAKKSFKPCIKMSHNVTTETKNLFEGNFA